MTLLQSKFLKKDTESFVAVNLGSHYIKGLAVRGREVSDYFIEKKDGLSDTLKEVWAKKKIPTKKVRVSIKDPSCLVRYFSFPKMEKKKLSQALTYELNKFIPFPAGEVYFDFSVLKEVNPGEVLILLAVVKRDFISKILEGFAKANLNVSIINLDSICLINLLFNNYADSKEVNSCILDIGSNISTMTILNKGLPFLTRDVKLSVKDILHLASRTKGVKIDDLENWARDKKNSQEFLELAQHNISNVCKEIKSSFDYFEVNKTEHIDRLYITGGLSSVSGIEKVFTESLDIDTEVLEVFKEDTSKFELSFSDSKFTSFLNSFSVTFGLIL